MADEQEQLNEESAVEVEAKETDPSTEETNDETQEIEENEIVLAGQESGKGESVPKNTNFVFNRLSKKSDKLQDENAVLKAQLQQQMALGGAGGAGNIEARPDEYDFDDRKEYLKADTVHQQKIVNTAITTQLNQQQNQHRIAAQQQVEEQTLKNYQDSAAKLKVPNFNDLQDKACDVLGDDFARSIVHTVPEDAPKLMAWFGNNPQEAAGYRDRFATNPGATTISLGRLIEKLTIKPRRSSAAQPESKVTAGGVSGGSTHWQKQIDKVNDASTDTTISKSLNAIRKIKKEAKASGFDVSTLTH